MNVKSPTVRLKSLTSSTAVEALASVCHSLQQLSLPSRALSGTSSVAGTVDDGGDGSDDDAAEAHGSANAVSAKRWDSIESELRTALKKPSSGPSSVPVQRPATVSQPQPGSATSSSVVIPK